MTSEDDEGLSEDDMDEIVNRVVDQLRDAGVSEDDGDEDGGTEIEVRTEDETGIEAGQGDAVDAGDADDDERDWGKDDEDRPEEVGEEEFVDDEELDLEARERARRRRAEARERREGARERKREAERRAREAREAAEGFEDLGDRIEAAVEARLDHLGEHLEHAIGPGSAAPPEPTMPGVVIGPDDTREKAVYKTQLQKGGRVAVPDTEIEALGLEPGDALQVVLYPVE